MRTNGILLHPTSLPGPRGSGDLGHEARRFVEFLARSGQSWWQMLPIHPPGPGNSPYQGLSTFAGSSQLIDLEELVQLELIHRDDLQGFSLPSKRRADFEKSAEGRNRILWRAFEVFERGEISASHDLATELEAFQSQHSSWLNDWTLFAALREKHGLVSWVEWEEPLARRDPERLEQARNELARECRFHAFVQLLFERQWNALRQFAAERGVRIMGDLPMFVAHDSADVWSRPELFRLGESGAPLCVSGAPPDDFNPGGQVWGHPLFDWDAVIAADWDWWTERVRRALALADSVRLDHFVGYNAAWEVPVPEKGRWKSSDGVYGPGPGSTLFEAIGAKLGPLAFVAEDLGDMNDAVETLRVNLGYPGMRVLQFAYSGEASENIHLPHNYARDVIAYTGTHDNDTIAGWFKSLDPESEERRAVLAMTGGTPDAAPWDLVKLAQYSVADMAIMPAQDLYGMGSRARMNRPGTTNGNWRFRLRPREVNDAKADELATLTRDCGRFRAQP
ncbi:MAG: 4-alpha-glucanotransferase [Planctomycetota bacterium]|jgi:4-alpha-glucanotransferase